MNSDGETGMDVTSDAIAILNYLLPGFVVAWVFYGLTSHAKVSPFERTVQAMIFSVPVKAIVIAFSWLCLAVYRWTGLSLGTWDVQSDFIYSLLVAVMIGHVVAWITNKNAYHELLYKWKLTSKGSQASEWHSAFNDFDLSVVLHLSEKIDNKRLIGWPKAWPEDPKSGHFVLTNPSWLIEENGRYKMIPCEVKAVLVPAENVCLVEFVEDVVSEQNEQAEQSNRSESSI